MRLAVLSLFLFAGVAHAQDPVEACISAADRAQSERDSGKLKAARESLLVCAAETCPPMIKADCVKWLEEVEGQLPSIVLRVKDSNGKEIVDGALSIDGEPAENALAGHALPIDPGEHLFRCTVLGHTPLEQKIIIRQGEKARVIDLVLEVAPVEPFPKTQPQPKVLPPPPQKDRSFEIPVLSYVLGGVGVLGGIGFAMLASQAKSERDDLRDTCAPNCEESDVDAARTKMILGDVSLGVGLLALGAAAYLVFDANAERPPVQAGFRPMRGGGSATFGGRF